MNMLWVALYAGIWYSIVGWRPGYSTHDLFFEPLVVSLPIGLIMGDVHGAIVIGAALSMMYLGMIAPGSELPNDSSLAGLVGIPIALALGADTGTAMAIAVPFGILGVFLNQIRRILSGNLAHKADKCALTENIKGIRNCAIWWPLAINLVLKFPVAFCAVYFGADVVENVINVLPAWVLNGFSAAGGLMPALGFAILLSVIGKRSIIPIFFIGFFLVKIFGISPIQVACLAIPFATMLVLAQKDAEDATVNRTLKLAGFAQADDDDDDDE